MQCVILAGGRGTRMGELTNNCPKPMLPVKNKPKLAYTIEELPEEITEIVLVIGYLGKQIENFFGKKYTGRKIKYVVQKELNGSAGAISLAKEMIKKNKALVLMGDDLYLKSDLKKLLNYSQSILVKKTNQAEQFGLVDVDKDGDLTAVVERPHGRQEGLVNTGAYVLRKEYFDFPPIKISTTEYGLPQTLVSMYPKYKTKIVTAQNWLSIGTPENLKLAEKQINKFISD